MSLMHIEVWVYGVSPTCRLHRPRVESPTEWASFPQADWANALNLCLSMSNYNGHQTLTKSVCEIIHNCFMDTSEKGTGCLVMVNPPVPQSQQNDVCKRNSTRKLFTPTGGFLLLYHLYTHLIFEWLSRSCWNLLHLPSEWLARKSGHIMFHTM